LINPDIALEIFLYSLDSFSNSLSVKYFNSFARYSIDLTSPQDTFAINKNRLKSASLPRSNPSAILFIFDKFQRLSFLLSAMQ